MTISNFISLVFLDVSSRELFHLSFFPFRHTSIKPIMNIIAGINKRLILSIGSPNNVTIIMAIILKAEYFIIKAIYGCSEKYSFILLKMISSYLDCGKLLRIFLVY